MIKSEIQQEYFEWMYEMVCHGRYADGISYVRLLRYLHEVPFTYIIRKDRNRLIDGLSLRRRFLREVGMDDSYVDLFDFPCSVLEVMIALAIRCEEFMDDTEKGDRTTQWFWKMVVNLGLGGMSDSRFNLRIVRQTVDRFLNREFLPDGRGSLFWIRNCECDMRNEEIWVGALWFLDSIG